MSCKIIPWVCVCVCVCVCLVGPCDVRCRHSLMTRASAIRVCRVCRVVFTVHRVGHSVVSRTSHKVSRRVAHAHPYVM